MHGLYLLWVTQKLKKTINSDFSTPLNILIKSGVPVIKSIQKGVLKVTDRGNRKVSISPVNLSKSIVLQAPTMYYVDNSGNMNGTYGCNIMYVCNFKDNHTLEFATTGSGTFYAPWTVIEFY